MLLTGFFEKSVSDSGERRLGALSYSTVLIVGMIASFMMMPMQAAPYVAENSDQVLIKRTYQILENKQNKVLKETLTLESALQLASSHIERALKNGGDEHYRQARRLLDPWWEQKTKNTQLQVARAQINQHYHFFTDALMDLYEVIERDAAHVQARLSRSAIWLALGELEKAKKDCQKLILSTDPLVVLNCVAQVDGMSGQAEYMERRLIEALKLDASDVFLREQMIITLFEVMLAQGKYEQAENIIKPLARNHDNRVAASHLNNLLLFQKRYLDLYRANQTPTDITARLYRDIAFSNLYSREYKKNPLFSNEEIFALHQDNSPDAVSLLAKYYLYIQKDADKALDYSYKNFNIQKTVPDALMLLDAIAMGGSSPAINAVESWLSKNSIKDDRITRKLELVTGG